MNGTDGGNGLWVPATAKRYYRATQPILSETSGAGLEARAGDGGSTPPKEGEEVNGENSKKVNGDTG